MAGQIIRVGNYYGRTDDDRLVPVSPWRAPDTWVCRRLADFPDQEIPPNGATAECSRCTEIVVFNPKRHVRAPKVCMQCAGITPLPMEGPS